jgi:micrococcal nuclease
MKAIHTLQILFLILATSAYAQTLEGKVTHVKDGDSIYIQHGNDETEIRFFGIDAPEWNQPYGKAATQYLIDEILGKIVRVEITHIGSWGRPIGKIYCGLNYINENMIFKGLAWVYRAYCDDCDHWIGYETWAKRDKLGLWADPNPIPPWEYRHMKK